MEQTEHSQMTGELQLSEAGRAVLMQRYVERDGNGNPVETPEQLFHRVATAVASAEHAYGTPPPEHTRLEQDFYAMMLSGRFLPNSPTLMNAGRGTGMLSGCFVVPVPDSVEGIFSAIRCAALIQKAGGGTGFNFSRLRPRGDHVASSSGTTSGPVSFMRVFSAATRSIQQGAFRRGANMGVMRVDHPDIIEFLNAKREDSELTNFNLSVGVSDRFIKQVINTPDAAHMVTNPRNGATDCLWKEDGSVPWCVGELFDLMTTRAWANGEPGLLFLDRINEANPTPFLGPIDATNPCGEQPLLPYESCNLGSINLSSFVSRSAAPQLDYESLRATVRLATRFLDNVIDVNMYPLPEIEEISKANRKIGLGVMGYADMLFALGIPYDSDEALQLAETVMRAINDEAHIASSELAEARGCFANWKKSVWAERGIKQRNAACTSIAPTGTVSIIAGCTSGIEPAFALAYKRTILDGREFVEMNPWFRDSLERFGLDPDEVFSSIGTTGSLCNANHWPDEFRRVFRTAHDIGQEWHVTTQAAFQRHCDASISKTINLPHDANVSNVRKAFLLAFEKGCKGVTVYRDDCRKGQPLAKVATEEDDIPSDKPAGVSPIDLPAVMPAVRIRQATPFGNMHVKVVIEPETGTEQEVFAQLGKGGDLANSDLEAICRLISLYLRVGGSLADITEQLEDIGSTLTVPTRDGPITSLADALAKAIGKYRHARASESIGKLFRGQFGALDEPRRDGHNGHGLGIAHFKVKCPSCGGNLFFVEACATCPQCGFSQC